MRPSWHVSNDPPDDALLRPAEVAEWLQVDASWLKQAIANDALPVMGYTSAGEPVVLAAEVRTWLRRPDPAADET
jgi:hypothetical protein